jgi:hypothetical protein
MERQWLRPNGVSPSAGGGATGSERLADVEVSYVATAAESDNISFDQLFRRSRILITLDD